MLYINEFAEYPFLLQYVKKSIAVNLQLMVHTQSVGAEHVMDFTYTSVEDTIQKTRI